MKLISRVALLLLVVTLCACAVAKRTKSVSSAFLSGIDVSKKLENMPFSHSWVWTDVSRDQYHAVIIKPVRVDLLEADSWKDSRSPFLSSPEAYDEKAGEIASYFQEQLVEKIKTYPETRYSVTDVPGAGVLVVEIALTELEFSHPGINAGAIAAPIPGVSQALATITDPHAAFALRLSDSKTGTLIATVADRKFPPIRMIDLNKATVSLSLIHI